MLPEKITLQNLAVIDIPHADKVPDRDWSWKDAGGFFVAEECDRQLLIGNKDDIEKLPEIMRQKAVSPQNATIDSPVIIATGEAAYRHLLNVAIGLLDKQLGEKETIEHIKARWRIYSDSAETSHAEQESRKEKFDGIMQAIFADSKAIRGKVFHDRVGGYYLRPVSTEPAVAARNMLDIRPVDNVLIIGEKDGITTNTIKIMDTAFRTQEHDGAVQGGIVVTHQDPAQYELLKREVEQLVHDHKLKGKVRMMPYEQAMAEVLPDADFVINCQPMDNGAADDALIQKAASRTNATATLVHLKGVPQDRNKSSQKWMGAEVDRVIFVESLQRQKELDNTHNQRMRGFAEIAVTNCINSRKIRRQPVHNRLLMEPEEYEAFIRGAGSGPRGPRDHADRPPEELGLGG